ncbi:hypothetical protein BDZ91DRAFT_743792 [Kalaharituber pfeilii]|nr:hypothetical protein BDZ91DRAFT_743792 [Kalaharituber pfeilii]
MERNRQTIRPQKGSATPGDNCSTPRTETPQCISTSGMSPPESPFLLTPSSSCFPSGVSELNMAQSPTPAAKNDVPPSTFPQHRPMDMQVSVEDIYPEGDLILNLRHSEKPSSVTPHKIAAPLVRFRVSSSAFRMTDGALHKLASLHTSETVDLFPRLPERLWGYRDDLVTVSLLMPVLRDVHISAFQILMKLIHSQTKEFFLDTSPFREPSAINLVTATAEVAWGLGYAHLVCPWVQTWLAHCQRNVPVLKLEEYIQVHEACSELLVCTSFQVLRLAIAVGDKVACRNAIVAILNNHNYSQLSSSLNQELFAVPRIIESILAVRSSSFSSAIPEYASRGDNKDGQDPYHMLGLYVAFLSKEFNIKNLEFPEDDSTRKLQTFTLHCIYKKVRKHQEFPGFLHVQERLRNLAGYVSEVIRDKRLESVIRIARGVRFPQLMDLSVESFPLPSTTIKNECGNDHGCSEK